MTQLHPAPAHQGCAATLLSNADVWYKFTAPATGTIVIETFDNPVFDGLNDSELRVFGACGGAVLFCDNDGGEGLMSKIEIPSGNYTPGSVYYIQVDGYGTARGRFSISVTSEDPVLNDVCTDAISLIIDGDPVQGNNTGATVTADRDIFCGLGDYDTDADVWYSFTAPANGDKLIIETANVTGAPNNLNDSQLQVFASCGSAASALYCDDDGGAGLMSRIEIPCGALEPYATYYIQVDAWNTARGVFKISIVSTPCAFPANDSCANAIPLVLHQPGDCPGNETSGTTLDASSDGLASGCETNNPDVFYSFNSGLSYGVKINIEEFTTNVDLGVSVYEESCAGDQIYCVFNISEHIIDVAPNTNYIVRVHSNPEIGDQGGFIICIEKVPVAIATINGTITGWNSNCATRNVTLSLYNVASGFTTVLTTTLSASGTFVVDGDEVPAGLYTVLVKVQGALAILREEVLLNSGANTFSAGPVRMGDINNDNVINFLDISAFSAAYGKSAGMPGYNFLADLNCDGVINVFDVSILSAGFNKVGDVLLSS